MSDHLVGVISDTHSLLRPEAVDALRGVDRILHAGDIGKPEVLERLAELAPVTAVRGNNDKDKWADELPDWDVVDIGEVSIYMLHDLKELNITPDAAGFDVVIAGHSHKPMIEERRGVLYLNPGSAGPRRFRLPISVAHLRICGGKAAAEIVYLSV
jgi:putative phosphoesterase